MPMVGGAGFRSVDGDCMRAVNYKFVVVVVVAFDFLNLQGKIRDKISFKDCLEQILSSGENSDAVQELKNFKNQAGYIAVQHDMGLN